MKKYICFALLAVLLLAFPFLAGAEDVEVDSRIVTVHSTYECGCRDGSYGVMVSRYGMVTRAKALYCAEHGKKYTSLAFDFGYLEEGLSVYSYTGSFTYRTYEKFPKGYDEENDIAYIKFAEPVGDRTGWYACKAASDKELKNTTLLIRNNVKAGIAEAELSSVEIVSKKLITFPRIKGTATGVPAFMPDGNGNELVIGIVNCYSEEEGGDLSHIRRITSRVYGDMQSDGLFKNGAETSPPSVTSLWREEDETGEGNIAAPQTAGGGEWTCPECGQEGNTGNFCPNCSAARPVTAAGGEWTCPVCGQEGNTGNFCPNCGAVRGEDAQTARKTPQVTVNEHLEQIPGETEKVKVRLQGVSASTFIEADNPLKWIPENAADGNETTCWQYSWKKGQWLELDAGAAEAVDEIWIKNGFWGYNTNGHDQYSLNSRPKKIRIQFLYSGESAFRDEQSFTLKDEWGRDWQRFTTGHHGNVTAVRIFVDSIYTGSYYKNDVCVSEVMLVQYASAAAAMPAQETPDAVVYESRPEVTGCPLLDRLATRSGPGTQFAEPGTFFRNDTWKGKSVRVLKKEKTAGVWWVQVDFQTDDGKKYRVWTGKKRVQVDLDKVKQEICIGDCDLSPTSDTRWGPGGDYAAAKISIRTNAIGYLYETENGWADVEYYADDGAHGRVWVPQSVVHNLDTSKDRSGEN